MPSFRHLVICTVFLGILAGCGRDSTEATYVARVGDQYLTQQKLSETLAALQIGSDTAEARNQIIEQWVTDALLYREAQRRSLASDPEVQQTLQNQRRSVLVNELSTRLYDEVQTSPSESDIQSYYDQHREQLRLREPFVHVRHLATPTLEAAETVRAELRAADDEQADSTWSVLIQDHATDPEQARSLAQSFYPEHQLFGTTPTLRSQLERLEPGGFAPILEIDSLFHVLQLVARAETGTIPEREWVEEEIQRRLRLRARKQMYAREVQRLRNEALAREELEIR